MLSGKKRKFLLFNALSCTAGGACYGLYSLPWSKMFAGNTFSSRTGRKRASHPRFILGKASSENGPELSVDAESLLQNKNNGRAVPFEEVVMRWGAWPLGIGDVLVKKCANGGSYYVARHIWGNDYRLDNGERVFLAIPLKQDFCGGGAKEAKKIRNANSLTLNFQKSGGQAISDLMIWVKSCEFQWKTISGSESKEKNLSVSCKGNLGERGSTDETVTLSLENDSYKD